MKYRKKKKFDAKKELATVRTSTLNLNSKRLIGTNLSLEKKYLRITDDPEPEEIRPLHIL